MLYMIQMRILTPTLTAQELSLRLLDAQPRLGRLFRLEIAFTNPLVTRHYQIGICTDLHKYGNIIQKSAGFTFIEQYPSRILKFGRSNVPT